AESLKQVEQLVGERPGHTGRLLLRHARRERLHLHLAEARRRMEVKDHAAAEDALRAAGAGQPGAARLQLLVRAARLWEEVGEPARAVEAWQVILEGANVRGLALTDEAGLPTTGGVLARAAVLRLLRAHREAVYAGAEKRARALWEAAPEGQREAA